MREADVLRFKRHQKENERLQAENARLKEALEWFKTDLAKIKTMNEPTFFTICERWIPHIDQAPHGRKGK